MSLMSPDEYQNLYDAAQEGGELDNLDNDTTKNQQIAGYAKQLIDSITFLSKKATDDTPLDVGVIGYGDLDALVRTKDAYIDSIQQDNSYIGTNMNLMNQRNKQITDKHERSLMQKRAILDKLNVIVTRNRMLQLSQEKNVYKGKILNTLIATIIAIILAVVLAYYYTMKK